MRRFVIPTPISLSSIMKKSDEKSVVVQDLKESWEFKQTDLDSWMPVKTVPTNVHLDLIANNV